MTFGLRAPTHDRSLRIRPWALRNRGSRLAVVLVGVAVCFASAPRLSAAEEPTHRPDTETIEGPHAVIDSGQDELLGKLLGQGEPLAGCTFASGTVQGGTIRAAYTCPSGEVVYQLVHTSAADPAATQTRHFALTLQSGSPPEGFAAALMSRIRAHEGAIKWTWIGLPPRKFSLGMAVLAIGALLVIAAVGWMIRSRRST